MRWYMCEHIPKTDAPGQNNNTQRVHTYCGSPGMVRRFECWDWNPNPASLQNGECFKSGAWGWCLYHGCYLCDWLPFKEMLKSSLPDSTFPQSHAFVWRQWYWLLKQIHSAHAQKCLFLILTEHLPGLSPAIEKIFQGSAAVGQAKEAVSNPFPGLHWVERGQPCVSLFSPPRYCGLASQPTFGVNSGSCMTALMASSLCLPKLQEE